MFDADCRACRSRVLLPLTRVLAVVPAPAGHLVLYRCRCGTVDAELIEPLPQTA
jgi:hypothetical protein